MRLGGVVGSGGWTGIARLGRSGGMRAGVLGAVLAYGLCLTSVLAAVTPSSAQASGFGIAHYSLTALNEDQSADTQAGSHPHELVAEATLDPLAQNTSTGEVKGLSFELPPGLNLDLAAGLHCTRMEFDGEQCSNGAVGTVQMNVAGSMDSATLYNLVPAPGEMAQLGFISGGISTIIDVDVRTGGDYGMTLSMGYIAQGKVESVKLTLTGGTYSPLLTMPTSCSGPSQTTLQGESWQGETASLPASFSQMTGCERLSFKPSIALVPNTELSSEPAGYALEVQVPQTEIPEGLVPAQPRRVAVTLPVGTTLSVAALNDLHSCGEVEFGLTSAQPGMCPAASQVGTAELQTPLAWESHGGHVEQLEGHIYMAASLANPFGSLVALYLEARGAGMIVKLAGQVTLNSATGQLTLAFDDMPQLPFSEIQLSFAGGAQALLVNPPTCGAFTAESELAPWSGEASVSPSASFAIDQGVEGTPCSVAP